MVSEASDGHGSFPIPPAGAAGSGRGVLPLEPEDALPLRLALARGSLGIELSRPVGLGPIAVTELALSLPELRYPVDLSRGVKQFRSRRGRLQRLTLQASLTELGQWLADPWREILGEPLLGVRVWALPSDPNDRLSPVAIGIGLGLYSSSRSLAFELLWCPQERPRLVLSRPRAVGAEVSAVALCLRALDALVARQPSGRGFERRGRMLELGDLPWRVCSEVLPAAGCRIPDTAGLLAGAVESGEGLITLTHDVDVESPDAPPPVLLTLEAALALEAADDCLARGEDEQARRLLIERLADSPGLPPALEALADLDISVPGRQEAALATLEEVGGAERAGPLGALALVAAGHIERARESLVRAAEGEAFGPLAAQILCRAAQLADQPALRLGCLDRAVARAPQLASARWLRFEDRVRRGDVEGALADAQHLEAAEVSVSSRHGVCLRAGRRLAEAGHGAVARRLLERALRYVPDDPAARAALGRLFAELGMTARAVTLLQGALQVADAAAADAGNLERSELLIDLGRLLADALGDLPQGIARLRQISARSPKAVEARSLEAHYCERLGDVSGASRAYGRLREAAELGWARGTELIEALCRGAAFEEGRGELAMAERHLHAALSLRPTDDELRAEYRRLASRASTREQGSPGSAVEGH